MSLYKKFKTSETHEQDGIWLDYGESGAIKIARAGGANVRYVKRIEKLQKKYKRQIQLDIMDDADNVKIMREAYADTVVLDWKGVTNEDDEPMEFNKQNCIKLFTDLPDLFLDVVTQATNVALFKEHLDEETAKN